MDRIKFLAMLRAVKQQAAKLGYCGDALADDVPLIGTLRQQSAIAMIGADVGGPWLRTTRDRELLGRFVRAAVLTSPSPAPISTDGHKQSAGPDAVGCAHRQGVDRRREEQRRVRRMKRDEIKIGVAPTNGRPQRLVIVEHLNARSSIATILDTNSATSRERFHCRCLARRFGADVRLKSTG